MGEIERKLRLRLKQYEDKYNIKPDDFTLGIIAGLSQAIAMFEYEREET